MADLPFLDSCAHYLTADAMQKWTSGASIDIGAGRYGGNAIHLEATGISKTFEHEYGQLYVGGAFRNPGNVAIQLVNRLSGLSMGLRAVGDGRFNFVGNDPTDTRWFPPVLWSGVTPPIAPSKYNYVELRAQVAQTGATMEARLNGDSVLTESVTFANPNPGTVIPHISFAALNMNGPGEGSYGHVCDIYVTTSGFYGDVIIGAIRPDGAGSYSDWTPNPGVANWINVADTYPDGDTSINSSATVGNIDSHHLQAVPTGVLIKGAQAIVSVKKDNAGLGAMRIRYGGTAGQESEEFYPPAFAYLMLRDGTEDSGILTALSSNALELGYRRSK